ncbi:helix-turn-helix domain-containing protein [Nocardia salmonicida]|uniref:helix-turn-helix domain-containing protein n=1 Tax=Nocardia salmonicida TaxID=53431 RepID=UPI0007A3C6D7|nr:helix-turn-helix transcriptional regulator [Nocardia salmonicida]
MSDQYDEDEFIGRRVRQIRARRGISQQVLADRVGLSRGAIAKYEGGERPLDSRRTQLALASALGVTLGDLTGSDDRIDPSTSAFHRAVPAIETALWTQGNLTDNRPPGTLDELSSAVEHASRLRQSGDYAALGPLLPDLLTDAYRLTDTGSPAAWDLLATAAYGVSSALRQRGHDALAWTAVQESERAAGHADSLAPVAAAHFLKSQILAARPGALGAALTVATGTADQLTPDASTRGELETVGMARLQAGFAETLAGGDPAPHLEEAAELASRLADAPTGPSTARNKTFGPANVALWRLSSAVERREPGEALRLAETLDPNQLPKGSRHALYFVETGRAYAMKRDQRAALHALLRAEHAAPQHVRGLAPVRELVGAMLREARRDLATGELGRLAQRVGVVPA